MSNELQKLKVSLCDTISGWIDKNGESEGFNQLDTFFSDDISELMSDAAFSILLSQSSLTKYYKEQGQLNDTI